MTATHIKWKLHELHESIDIKSTNSLVHEVRSTSSKFTTKYKGQLNKLSSEELMNAIEEFELIKSKIIQLSQFSHLNYATNFKSDDVLGFMNVVELFSNEIGNELLFFFLELGNSDQKSRHSILTHIGRHMVS